MYDVAKAYETLSKASGLKVGDYVEVMMDTVDGAHGWDNVWTPTMRYLVGRRGHISEIDHNRGVCLEETTFYRFPFFVLKKVDEKPGKKTYEERSKDSGLKVGDFVKITRSATSHEDGWENSWNSEMTEMVGKCGHINFINHRTGICFKEFFYIYPYFILEKVAEPTPKPVLHPFEKVLVRNTDNAEWDIDFFRCYKESGSSYPYRCIRHPWEQCIPYEGNHEMFGTNQANLLS